MLIDRRQMLAIGSSLGLIDIMGSAWAAETSGAMRVPQAELVYSSDITLSDTLPFGETTDGTRRIIPITGGTFEGPQLRGKVLSIGADWNLSRSDGARSVEAAYYLKTDDGVTIRIFNAGVGDGPASEDPTSGEKFFMFTRPTFDAPKGKYDWLNKSTFLGTLGARRNTTHAVLVRVFKIV